MTPLGIRQNNPGNIRPGEPWAGAVGEQNGFVVFDSAIHGIRALAKNLMAYQTRHGLLTIRGMVSRWAPPSDNNDTEAYIAAVCKACGVAPETEYLLTPDRMYALVKAIIQHENGQQPYDEETIRGAVAMAYGAPEPQQPAAPISDAPEPAQHSQPHPEKSRATSPEGASSLDQTRSERTIPKSSPRPSMSAILLALLPTIIQNIPALFSIFGSGSEVAKRNEKAAQLVADTVVQATGAVNLQEAVEKIQNDPAAKAVAQAAVLEVPAIAQLLEVGGGVQQARKDNIALMQAADTWWKMLLNPVLIVTFATLPLVYIFVWKLVDYLNKVSSDVISQTMGTVIGLVLGGIIGFWMGQTYQSAQRRDAQQ